MRISVTIARHLLSKIDLAGYGHLLRQIPAYATLELLPPESMLPGHQLLDILEALLPHYPEGELAYDVEYRLFHGGQLGMLGALGQLVQVSDNVGEMSAHFFAHYSRYNELFVPELVPRGPMVVFRLLPASEVLWQRRGYQVLVEMFLYGALKMIRDLFASPSLSPESLTLPYQPPAADVLKLEATFGTPLIHGSACAVAWPASLLQQPLPFANPSLKEHLHQFLKQQPAETASIGEQVKRQIAKNLPRLITLEETARLLCTGSRTLQRQLRAADTSFQQIQEDVRQHLATQLLQDSSQNLKEIALACGFSDSNSFFRAFKKWTGKSPGEFRLR